MARVAVVDDAMFMRTILGKILEELGHEIVAQGENGLEAIEIAKEHKPDLITLDITMPEMDGLAAVPKIIEAYPEAKIIMVSAMGQKNMVVDAIKSGAKEFIVKPFEKTIVEQAISKVL